MSGISRLLYSQIGQASDEARPSSPQQYTAGTTRYEQSWDSRTAGSTWNKPEVGVKTAALAESRLSKCHTFDELKKELNVLREDGASVSRAMSVKHGARVLGENPQCKESTEDANCEESNSDGPAALTATSNSGQFAGKTSEKRVWWLKPPTEDGESSDDDG